MRPAGRAGSGQLDDDPIASAALGFVQRHVGRRSMSLSVSWPARETVAPRLTERLPSPSQRRVSIEPTCSRDALGGLARRPRSVRAARRGTPRRRAVRRRPGRALRRRARFRRRAALVADRVAEPVVDGLEVVEVGDQHRARRRTALASRSASCASTARRLGRPVRSSVRASTRMRAGRAAHPKRHEGDRRKQKRGDRDQRELQAAGLPRLLESASAAIAALAHQRAVSLSWSPRRTPP